MAGRRAPGWRARARAESGPAEPAADAGSADPGAGDAAAEGRPTVNPPAAHDTIDLAGFVHRPADWAEPGEPTPAEREHESRLGERRRRWRIGVGVAAGVVALLVAAVLVGLFSPLLKPDAVAVSGTQRASADGIERAVLAEFGDTALPLVGADEVGAAVRREFPIVTDVRVEKQWPRGLRLAVSERRPIAAVPRGDQLDLVDATGFVVETVREAPAGVPRVRLEGSARGDDGAAVLSAALVAAGQLPDQVRDQVEEVVAAGADQLSFTLTKGRTVVWGGTDQGELKARVVALLLDRGRTVDVTVPEAPVTR